MQNDTHEEGFLDNGTFVWCIVAGAAVAVLTGGAWFAVFGAGVVVVAARKGLFAYLAAKYKALPRKRLTPAQPNTIVIGGRQMRIVGKVVKKEDIPQEKDIILSKNNNLFSPFNQPDNPLSVRLGSSKEDGSDVIIDFMKTYHIGLFGMSGCGKDNLLRCIFLALALRNDPADVQFAFIDGKGEWLIDPLPQLAHMFIPPAGGYGDAGDARMLDAIKIIDDEASRRSDLFCKAGCVSREEYIEKTGERVPLIFVVMSDVMGTVEGDLEKLLANLVSKARSIGMRVILSMQTPTGKSTKWRTNLGANLSGYQSMASQDAPSLGCDPSDMRVRPSELPADEPGVFVYRNGRNQYVLKAPFLTDEDRNKYFTELGVVKRFDQQLVLKRNETINETPVKRHETFQESFIDANTEFQAQQCEVSRVSGISSETFHTDETVFLGAFLTKNGTFSETPETDETVETFETIQKIILTREQQLFIVSGLKQRKSVSEIVKKMPGAHTTKYKEYKLATEAFIDVIMAEAKKEMEKQK